MQRTFNVTGLCTPTRNYMVDISGKVEQIVREYIMPGKYFTINRARQYGKTTTLHMLEERLKDRFYVCRLSFEAADEYFASPATLAEGLSMDIARCLSRQNVAKEIMDEWQKPISERFPMRTLGERITALCQKCDRKVILMIDEVDKSSDNQIFLSFLGLLRSKYLNQLAGQDMTFWSVILAGVFMETPPRVDSAAGRSRDLENASRCAAVDVKNLKQKLHPGEESKYNSPWNIAADFTVDMDFSADDIASMLMQYETDWKTGMNVEKISRLLYDYTSGYPFLVSRLCQIMDQNRIGQKASAWDGDSFQDAVREIVKKPNMLFDDMTKKLADYPKLKEMIYGILFQGKKYSYEPENERIRIGEMFGFLKERDGQVCVSNRIFEMKLYNLFLSEDETETRMFTAADSEKSQFIRGGHLQMELVLQKFCEYFEEIYSDADDTFIEDNGRRIFLIFLKPIINGSGNYYIETRTRNMKRTDVIIDYRGVQNVIEMKIWHGQEYNRRGENQLLEYMEYYHLDKGYMLSFNFNREKETGIRTLQMGSKVLVEAVV